MASWIVRTYVRTYLVEPHAESLEQLGGRGGLVAFRSCSVSRAIASSRDTDSVRSSDDEEEEEEEEDEEEEEEEEKEEEEEEEDAIVDCCRLASAPYR